jgi:hypothetical protein
MYTGLKAKLNFLSFFCLVWLCVGCSQGTSDLEITLGTDFGTLIPKGTQSCAAQYAELKAPMSGTRTYDVTSKYFSLKKPRITWNDPESDLDIISVNIASSDSSAIKVSCTFSLEEMAVLFGIPQKDSAVLDDAKLWNGTLYGTSTAKHKECFTASGNGETAGVANNCNYRQGSGLCNLICGGVSAEGGPGTSVATLTVIGVKTDSKGNQSSVRVSTPITVENTF